MSAKAHSTRIARVTDVYIRHYRDNGQTTIYVEWEHMRALINRAGQEGVPVRGETR